MLQTCLEVALYKTYRKETLGVLTKVTANQSTGKRAGSWRLYHPWIQPIHFLCYHW